MIFLKKNFLKAFDLVSIVFSFLRGTSRQLGGCYFVSVAHKLRKDVVLKITKYLLFAHDFQNLEVEKSYESTKMQENSVFLKRLIFLLSLFLTSGEPQGN